MLYGLEVYLYVAYEDTRPPGAIGVGLSLDPEGRLKAMGSI